MCYYIKDDGKQCGMDEDPYCRHHDDTIQAQLYKRTAEKYGDSLDPKLLGVFWHAIEDAIEEKEDEILHRLDQMHSEDETGRSEDFNLKVVDGSCDVCETALRRTSRVSRHPNQPRRLVFEEAVECQCDEHVLDAKSALDSDLPEGWS